MSRRADASARENAIHDSGRLAALRATALLDSPPERCFDDLTRLAARSIGAPAAFLSLVDETSDFFKSQFGFAESGIDQSRRLEGETFCHYSIVSDGPLAIEDARNSPAFHRIPTIRSLGVIAYLGIPLVTEEGHALGAFCVIDYKPRHWTGSDISTALLCARAAMREIAARTRPNAGSELPAAPKVLEALSPREREVLRRLLRGQRQKQIAADLGLSAKTVATHKARLMRKLDVEDDHQLLRLAVQQGLIDWN